MASLDSLALSVAALEHEIRSLHKDLRKVLQMLKDPTGEKAKERSENNSFKKPLQVSKELQTFLNLSDGQTISRSDVTKAIKEYAGTHNLKNGQEILLDDALRTLLNAPADTKITYLNIQRYLKHHYVAGVPVETPAETPAETPTPVKKGRPVAKKA
jgi:upstream activation factor subunit UAF30